MKKKLLSLVVAIGLVFSTAAALPENAFSAPVFATDEQTQETQYQYKETDDGTLTLTRYLGESKNVEIPESIDGKKVTSLGQSLFAGDENMETVMIPMGIINIGSKAFEGCKIKSVDIPESVVSIESEAFRKCEQLKTVKITENVTSIGRLAFSGTPWLESLESSSKMAVVNGILLEFADLSAETVTIPKKVTTIGVSAFEDMTKLESVTIPSSVTKICDCAFRGCTKLTDLTVPDSVESIGDHAFGYVFVNNKYQKINGFRIFCYNGSAAQIYAQENGFDCVLIDADPQRIYGSDRFETSFKIADQFRAVSGGKKFENVIIASGLDFADALCSAYLAKVKNAPILLTSPSVTDKVAEYISQNADSDATVYIIGGSAAVSPVTETKLGSFKTIRLAGPDRFTTNLVVLKEANVTNQEVIIASGLSYADALSASAVGKPILMVSGKSLSEGQISYLKTIASRKATVIGGINAVSDEIQTQAKSYFNSVNRIGGADRFETSANVAANYFSSADKLMLAYGLNYPDGLCGGPLAMKYKCPLILAANSNVYAAKKFAVSKMSTSAVTLGGKGLISDDSVRAILSTGLTASYTANSISLSWNAVYGAAKYDIYKVGTEKTKLGSTTSNSVNFKCLEATTYKIEVVPVAQDGTAIEIKEPLFIIIGTDPQTVDGLKASSRSSYQAQLTWNAKKCSLYQIFRKSTGEYELIGTSTSPSYTDNTVTGGKTYEYVVRTVYTDGSGLTHYSAYSAPAKLTTTTQTPTFLESISGDNYITVQWNKIEGATYHISIQKDGVWTTYSTSNNYYTFNNLTRSTAYSFSLYAEIKNGSSVLRSNTAYCTLSTDSTVKSKTNFVIYASPSTNAAVLYTGGAGVVLTRKGAYTDTWYKVYIPGTGKNNYGFVQASQVAGYVYLNFGPIAQLGWSGGAPLPTGCETTALATLLACHLGLPCTKNLLADKFLTVVGYRVGDPNYASWGSPYDENAYGVMAPALAETANRFLKSIGVRNQYQIDVHTDNDANMSWHKLDTGDINHSKGLDLEGIKKELEKGHAVQIWWITRGADPDSYTTFTINRGERYSHDGVGTYNFTWVGTQHGSVISGYDEATGQFIIADVGWGYTVRHSISHFMKIYTIQGRQSIVIYKK